MWDVDKVQELFSRDDADDILATRVPQQVIGDIIAWSRSSNGLYTVKFGYRLWHAQNAGSLLTTQSGGWNKIWRLVLPHKMKIFVWRFCRNNLPVWNRLRIKKVTIPIVGKCGL